MDSQQTLRWKLYPHRSLGPRGFRWMMAGLGFVCAFAALRFYVVNAWPVILFMVFDIGLIFLAFRISYARAAAFEEVSITDGKLIVRQVSHLGVAKVHEFNAYWAKVLLEEINKVQSRLIVVAQGRQLEIGHFLAPFEREDIHADITRGLAQAKLSLG
jgi:uncharacterized membrane protein